MSLPAVTPVIYDVTIQELNKKIKYRAFLVEEHKSLLTAIELKQESSLINTIHQIVKNCTFGEVDMDKLPVHVVDFLYLKIHAKSTGDTQLASYTCSNPILQEDQTFKECQGAFTLKLDMDKAKIVYPPDYDTKKVVMVDDKVGIRLKVPSFEDFRTVKLDKSVLDITDSFIFACIESVFTPTEVNIPGKDFTADEMIAWMNKLDGLTLSKISEFFQELPYLGMDISVTCPLCGKKEDIQLRGLEDFFE